MSEKQITKSTVASSSNNVASQEPEEQMEVSCDEVSGTSEEESSSCDEDYGSCYEESSSCDEESRLCGSLQGNKNEKNKSNANIKTKDVLKKKKLKGNKSNANIKTKHALKKKKLEANKSYESNSKYRNTCSVKEDHGMPIYACQLNWKLKDGEPLILATVGSNRVSVYECVNDGSLKILQVYADPDKEERFYTCAWTHDKTGSPLLAVAGERGVIRILGPAEANCVRSSLGHGSIINDLTFHPKDPNLLLSASRDRSLRMWNVQTGYCVAIFAGEEGHYDQVLSVDINDTGSLMVSSGMDHCVKVWKLETPEIMCIIRLSYQFNEKCRPPFPTVKQHFPIFSTRRIHTNYVDCAKWFGDLIMSKSCQDVIVCWKGGKSFQTWDQLTVFTEETLTIQCLDIEDCDIWYLRFSMDFWRRTLALGNKIGETYIYDLNVAEPSMIESTILAHPKCKSPIRQTALSRDGSVLICVCEDSTIWRWDVNKDDYDD